MSPVTHFFAGWLLASVYPTGSPTPLTSHEKILVVAAAVAPDIDGLGLLPELLTRNSSHPLMWFSQYHHSLHTLAFAFLCTLSAFLIASNFGNSSDRDHYASTHPWLTASLVLVSFHVHLLCDLIGARGPDGYQWPIPYLKPFSNAMQLTWHGQWALNGWQNFAFTGLLLITTLWFAWKYNSSPLELVSQPANQAFIQTLHQRVSLKP